MKRIDFQVVFSRPLSAVKREWERSSHGLCLAMSDGCSALGIELGVSKVNFRMDWAKAEVLRAGSILELPVNTSINLTQFENQRAKAIQLWSDVKCALIRFENDLKTSLDDIERLDRFVIGRNFGSVVIGKKQRNADRSSDIKWAQIEAHIYPEESSLYIRCGIKNTEVCSKISAIGSSYFEWRRYFQELTFYDRQIVLKAKVSVDGADRPVKLVLPLQ